MPCQRQISCGSCAGQCFRLRNSLQLKEKNGKFIKPQADLGIMPRSLRIELEPLQVNRCGNLIRKMQHGHSEKGSLADSLKTERLHRAWFGALQQRGSSSWFGSWAQHPANGCVSLLLCAQAMLNFILQYPFAGHGEVMMNLEVFTYLPGSTAQGGSRSFKIGNV